MSDTITRAATERILSEFSVSLTSAQFTAVEHYIALLLHWNKRVSLTTVTDPEEIVQRHFGESFFAVGAVPLREGRLADVGSGAGFPGAPIALLNPALDVTLIESNTRKAAFLETVRSELKLPNLNIAKSRVDDCADLRSLDFVTARAFGPYDELLALLRKSNQSVQVILWIGEEDAKVLVGRSPWKWKAPIRVPNSARRVLLIGIPELSEVSS